MGRKTYEISSIGRVISVSDGIAYIKGLREAKVQELVQFSNKSDVLGLVLNLEFDKIGAVILGREDSVRANDSVIGTSSVIRIPVGKSLLGKVVDPLGINLSTGRKVVSSITRNIEVRAPGIIERTSVYQPLLTGIKVIDGMVPVGKGQRELILGDRQTGKTTIAIDALINQFLLWKNKRERKVDISYPVFGVYVAIGQRMTTVSRIVNLFKEKKFFNFITVVGATASSPFGLQYLAPYSGCSIGEYWRDLGANSLVVYDDLSKHAVIYRQMSLLLGRPPGREAYPGDVFYLHSRLLERAGKLLDSSDSDGVIPGGSLTALPIVETVEGDISAYIATNIISITDGQIYLDSTYFSRGVRPAVHPGLSVSRIGSAAQGSMTAKIAGTLKLDLAQFREVEEFSKFGSILDEATQRLLTRGQILVSLLGQKPQVLMKIEDQIISITAGITGCLDMIPLNEIKEYEKYIIENFNLFTNVGSILAAYLNNTISKDDYTKIYSSFIPGIVESLVKKKYLNV